MPLWVDTPVFVKEESGKPGNFLFREETHRTLASRSPAFLRRGLQLYLSPSPALSDRTITAVYISV
jgi:hypothetical protein